jgi:hypothetical protein
MPKSVENPKQSSWICRALISFAAMFWCSITHSQPTTRPNAGNAVGATEQSELGLLRRTAERQQQEIEALRTDNAALIEQIRSLGLVPVTLAATRQPVLQSPVRRVVFVRISNAKGESAQIVAAVKGLEPTQYFNVITPTHTESYLFQPQLVQATDVQKEKLREYLSPNSIIMGDWLNGLEAAAKWNPDVICLAGGSIPPHDEEQLIVEMKKRLAGTHSRVNTSLGFLSYGDAEAHLLWRIAKETGGQCSDKSSQPISEPALPVKPLPKPPPAEPKSILPTN